IEILTNNSAAAHEDGYMHMHTNGLAYPPLCAANPVGYPLGGSLRARKWNRGPGQRQRQRQRQRQQTKCPTHSPAGYVLSCAHQSKGMFSSVPKLLALAELIIDAIAANGEAADLESIYAFIKEVTTA